MWQIIAVAAKSKLLFDLINKYFTYCNNKITKTNK